MCHKSTLQFAYTILDTVVFRSWQTIVAPVIEFVCIFLPPFFHPDAKQNCYLFPRSMHVYIQGSKQDDAHAPTLAVRIVKLSRKVAWVLRFQILTLASISPPSAIANPMKSQQLQCVIMFCLG
jgi:hypothetical protein